MAGMNFNPWASKLFGCIRGRTMIMNENASSELMNNWMSSGGAISAPGSAKGDALCDYDMTAAAGSRASGFACPYEPELDAELATASLTLHSMAGCAPEAGIEAAANSSHWPYC
jgi:hypothetical protein